VLLGGVLTAELSWRWVLFINVPIGIAAAFVAIIFLGEAKGTGPRQRLDLPGAITVTAGLAALVYAIVGTDQYAWGSAHTLICLVAAAVLLAVFFVLQQRGRSPLMPLRLFRIRGVTGANIVIFLVGAVFFSMWYFLSLYLQDVLGYGALRAGLAFLPMGIAIIIGAQATSRAMPRTGIRPLLLGGTLLVSAGFFGLSQIGPGSHYWGAVFGPGVVVSLALGVLFTPLAAAATAGVDRSEAGLASGLLNTSRQIGGSLGLAILATLASTHTHALEGTGVAAGHALADGFARAFLVGGFVGIAAFVAAFVVPGHTGTSKSTTTSYPATVPASTLDGDPAVLPVTMPAETSSSGTG
jgi:predicted MFS family arabinose efflux permease